VREAQAKEENAHLEKLLLEGLTSRSIRLDDKLRADLCKDYGHGSCEASMLCESILMSSDELIVVRVLHGRRGIQGILANEAPENR